MPATDKENVPVVIKLGCDSALLAQEARALEIFNGQGSIALLDYHKEYNALLLQQALPGMTLKSMHSHSLDMCMSTYVDSMKKLHCCVLPSKHPFPPITTWVQDLDRAPTGILPSGLLTKALPLKNQLLNSLSHVKLLHGDLHLDNILYHKPNWLCIDPKGVLGEEEFEIAAFNFIREDELEIATSELFLQRIECMASKAQLSFQRITDWVFLRLLLSAIWSIEDKGKPDHAIKLAKLLEKSVSL